MSVAEFVAALFALALLAWVLWPLLPERRHSPAGGAGDTACPACGNQLEADAQFCSSCGRALD